MGINGSYVMWTLPLNGGNINKQGMAPYDAQKGNLLPCQLNRAIGLRSPWRLRVFQLP